MTSHHVEEEAERAKRVVVMEWILYGRRVWIAAAVAVLLVAGTAFGIVYAIAVSHLSPSQQAVYVQREEEDVNDRWAPLFGRIVHRTAH